MTSARPAINRRSRARGYNLGPVTVTTVPRRSVAGRGLSVSTGTGQLDIIRANVVRHAGQSAPSNGFTLNNNFFNFFFTEQRRVSPFCFFVFSVVLGNTTGSRKRRQALLREAGRHRLFERTTTVYREIPFSHNAGRARVFFIRNDFNGNRILVACRLTYRPLSH